MGWCRLKLAGVEHCGLCGIAHFGQGRTCPHLNSESQVATLLGTLKESTESRELVEMATKYLRSIRGGLVQKKRDQEKRNVEMMQQQQRQQQPWNGGRGASLVGGSGSGGGSAYQQPHPVAIIQQHHQQQPQRHPSAAPFAHQPSPLPNRAVSMAPQYP